MSPADAFTAASAACAMVAGAVVLVWIMLDPW